MNGMMPNGLRKIRSHREQLFADRLTALHLEWQYEPVRFRLPAPYKHYTPDFYLPQADKYLELVGTRQAYSQAKEKIKLFKKCYPEIAFNIVDGDGNTYDSRATLKKLGHAMQKNGMVPRSVRFPGTLRICSGPYYQSIRMSDVSVFASVLTGRSEGSRCRSHQ